MQRDARDVKLHSVVVLIESESLVAAARKGGTIPALGLTLIDDSADRCPSILHPSYIHIIHLFINWLERLHKSNNGIN